VSHLCSVSKIDRIPWVTILALCDRKVLARNDPVDAESTRSALVTGVSFRRLAYGVAGSLPFDIERSGRWLWLQPLGPLEHCD
jgi:hypothetical protein